MIVHFIDPADGNSTVVVSEATKLNRENFQCTYPEESL
jgi:hypothetical protein